MTHKTEAIARAKKHAKENRELIQLRQRNYRESDPQKYSEYARQYRQKNAVRVANHKAKRRAVQAKVYVEYVDRAVALARENGRCYLCQKKITLKTMHLDRVVALVNGGEHSYANCRAACAKCNLRKGAR